MSTNSFIHRIDIFGRHSFSILIFIIVIDYLMGLELVQLHVPQNVNVGIRARLSCFWALEASDVLYSVKWYKDGNEFFRHVPRDVQPYRKFLLPGVDVEDFNSSGSNLTLVPADLETAGRYRCEISGERPQFHTVSEYADMRVIAVPSQVPIISGFKSQYSFGDNVQVNCTTARSRPATQLAWYINGEAASPASVLPAVYTSNNGLETTNLGLIFRINDHNLVGELKIKCIATLPSVYWRSVEEIATVYNGNIKDISKDDMIVTYSAKTNGALKIRETCLSWWFPIFYGIILHT